MVTTARSSPAAVRASGSTRHGRHVGGGAGSSHLRARIRRRRGQRGSRRGLRPRWRRDPCASTTRRRPLRLPGRGRPGRRTPTGSSWGAPRVGRDGRMQSSRGCRGVEVARAEPLERAGYFALIPPAGLFVRAVVAAFRAVSRSPNSFILVCSDLRLICSNFAARVTLPPVSSRALAMRSRSSSAAFIRMMSLRPPSPAPGVSVAACRACAWAAAAPPPPGARARADPGR